MSIEIASQVICPSSLELINWVRTDPEIWGQISVPDQTSLMLGRLPELPGLSKMWQFKHSDDLFTEPDILSQYETIDPARLFKRAITRYPVLSVLQEQMVSEAIGKGMDKSDLQRKIQFFEEAKEKDLPRWRNVFSDSHDVRDILYFCNFPLVCSVVMKHFIGTGIDFKDLFQEGTFGLMEAAQEFDPNLGFKFSTRAYSKIRGAISQAVPDLMSARRIPAKTITAVAKTKRTLSEVYGVNIEDLSPDSAIELSLAAGMDPKVVRNAELMLTSPLANIVSLEKPTEEGSMWGEIAADPAQEMYIASAIDNVANLEVCQTLADILQELDNPRISYLILRVLGFIYRPVEDSNKQLGKECGINRETARLDIKAGMEFIRRHPKAKELQPLWQELPGEPVLSA